ncbi:Surfeit locus 1 family protein [Methylovirgula ligni]|uniref:SURF1-like protein n=1 Tax=Methylovirgula ligni TaxID=569860 RepID=A0A3D9YZL7_9HYPH|nr:Surfeit locus 1 family protein [Methylovirgula ligni]REF87825.1 surfeit locus 1 family protein [Methylovirgula ligni]
MTAAGGARRRPLLARLGLLTLVFLAIAGLTGLGIWQLHRRVWKLDLIARVDGRVHATPIAAPGPADWPAITAAKDEYLRVRVAGRFLNDRETLVQALTDLGEGFWVLTPLRTDEGFTVLVNRGFVPPDRSAAAQHNEIAGETSLIGLLRISEPKGRFLRPNDPAQNRWYSRDVAAIAAARGLKDVAPYFIDAEAKGGPNDWPRAGLTVLSFPNNHLVYALTWFSLALMLAGVTLYNVREDWRRRRHGAENADASAG